MSIQLTRILARRLKLQALFEEILGSREAYFQPPENQKITYPAIIYHLEDIDNTFADNLVYGQQRVYNVTVISKDPDNDIVDKISQLPTCRFNRHYVADNLNHDVFILYY